MCSHCRSCGSAGPNYESSEKIESGPVQFTVLGYARELSYGPDGLNLMQEAYLVSLNRFF